MTLFRSPDLKPRIPDRVWTSIGESSFVSRPSSSLVYPAVVYLAIFGYNRPLCSLLVDVYVGFDTAIYEFGTWLSYEYTQGGNEATKVSLSRLVC